MSNALDLLIFVEDPGAANYVVDLPAALGWRTKVLACASARDFLNGRGIISDEPDAAASADGIIAQAKPRLVMVGTSENSDTLGLALIEAARAAGVPSVGVVDAPMNSELRFKGRGDDPLGYAPDWLLVPDELTRKTYQAIGYPIEHVIVCGHPHYDHVQAVAKRLSTRDPLELRRSLGLECAGGRPVVVFVAERLVGFHPRGFYRTADYTLRGRGVKNGRDEIVMEELLDAVKAIGADPYMVLRLHPKSEPHEFAEFFDQFDQVSRQGSSLELAFSADLVVGMTSMLVLEAALMGKPTLSIVPLAMEKEWAPNVMMGITPCVTTRAQLREVLPGLLESAAEGTSRAGNEVLSCGNCTERVIQALSAIRHTKVNIHGPVKSC